MAEGQLPRYGQQIPAGHSRWESRVEVVSSNIAILAKFMFSQELSVVTSLCFLGWC